MSSKDVEQNDYDFPDLREAFQLLDAADGHKDGKIKKDVLLKWIRDLELQNQLDNKTTLEMTGTELKRMFSDADENKDGYVNREEFETLIASFHQNLTKKQQSILRHYLWVIAWAEEYRCWPPPLFMIMTAVLQMTVYIVHQMVETKPECSTLVLDPERRSQIWRFFTYSVVHGSQEHIIFNVAAELLVGLSLEMTHRSWRVALVYTSGVLAAALASTTFDPSVYLVGASGGVYALITAHLATLILNWEEDSVILRRRIRNVLSRVRSRSTQAKHGKLVRLIRLLFVLGFTGFDTGMAIHGYLTERDTKTSIVAHGCGALAGLLFGIAVLKNRKVEPWENKLRKWSFLIFLIFNLAAIFWNLGGNFITQHILSVDYFRPEMSGLRSQICKNITKLL